MTNGVTYGLKNLDLPLGHAWRVIGWDLSYEVNAKGNPWRPGQAKRKTPLEYVRFQVHCETCTKQMFHLQDLAGHRTAEVFGIFSKMLEYAARHKVALRGWILDRHQQPVNWLAFCRDFTATLEQIDHALGVLSNPKVGWMGTAIFSENAQKKNVEEPKIILSTNENLPELRELPENGGESGNSPGIPGTENKNNAPGIPGKTAESGEIPGTPGKQAESGDSPGIPAYKDKCINKEEDINPPPNTLTTTQSIASPVPKEVEEEVKFSANDYLKLLQLWARVKPLALDPHNAEAVKKMQLLIRTVGTEAAQAAIENYRNDCELFGREFKYRKGIIGWVREKMFIHFLPENYRPIQNTNNTSTTHLIAQMETQHDTSGNP